MNEASSTRGAGLRPPLLGRAAYAPAPSRGISPLGWVFAGLSLALGVGCSLALELPPSVTNTCVDSQTCGGGSCVNGMCVTTELDRPHSVVFEVVPAHDASQLGAGPVVFEPVSIERPVEHDLMVPDHVAVVGSVFYGEDSIRVPAQISFTPRPSFEGAPSSEIRVSSDGLEGGGQDFVALLNADRIYDVVVEPTGAAVTAVGPMLGHEDGGGPSANQVFPPIRVEGVVPSSLADGRLDFQYPSDLFSLCGIARSDGCTLGGKVVSVDETGAEAFEPGIRVRAVDSDGRAVSSSVVTGSEGEFEIRLSEGVHPYRIRVTPPDEMAELPVLEAAVDLALPLDERRVMLPRLSPIALHGIVGYVDGHEVHRVDGAAVSFESTDLLVLDVEGTAQYGRTAFTTVLEGQSGAFHIDLLPGTYRVVVTPSESDRAGVLVTSVTIDPRVAGATIRGQFYGLPVRGRIVGTAATPSGEPVPLAMVRARRQTPSSDLSPGAIQRFGRSSETTTNEEGVYSLPIDIGAFDLIMRPGSGSGFAWHVVHSVVVEFAGRDREIDLEMAAPVPVSGSIVDHEGAPMSAALIRAYAYLERNGEMRSLQIGEATTDAAGRYRILLPGKLRRAPD